MIKILFTSQYVLQIERIEQSENGPRVLLTNGDGIPVALTGTLIHSYGGIDNFLAACEDSEKTMDELRKDSRKKKAPTIDEYLEKKNYQIKKIKAINRQNEINYHRLLTNEQPNECTPKNICTIMRYLNRIHYSKWGELPKMNIRYTCRQWEKQARNGTKMNDTYITMILDEHIVYKRRFCRNFIFGCHKLGKFKSVFGEDGLREDKELNYNKENHYEETADNTFNG